MLEMKINSGRGRAGIIGDRACTGGRASWSNQAKPISPEPAGRGRGRYLTDQLRLVLLLWLKRFTQEQNSGGKQYLGTLKIGSR